MVLGLLKNIFNDNERELKRLKRIVEQVNELEGRMKLFRDDELKAKTAEFKNRLAQGETLDQLLPEAFAVVREASRRVLGMRHFDVQILGGIVLHQGRIAEMKTGEGKTLVATLPAYLNALTGKGVHIVTVNDYLARRDSEWMGQIYKFLGLSVGLIVHGLDHKERQEAYAADITYGTNNEFGFDYLRDNMVTRWEHMVQRPLHYAIIDEVDSILIDEARTPLIISGQLQQSTDFYEKIDRVVYRLKPGVHYTVDEKARTVSREEEGTELIEKILGIENIHDGSEENREILNQIDQALKAHALMKRDRDYVVKDGKIIIVDEFTGRLMYGRRYSDGLHQAIEAKEGVKVEERSQTLASITIQNYFRMYEKLAGMTGTAATEEDEFRKIYNLDVVVIPTNEPMIRVDYPDVIYKTERVKFQAVVEEIVDCYRRGQPVLVGTVSIENSEYLSRLLKQRGIPHNVLNAKYHEKEAEIVAQAGRLGAVTIATNMAGRGTDILLGGNPEFLAKKIVAGREEEIDPEEYERILALKKEETAAEHKKVVELGGLHIIGTERHEARRIDNQLRGRSGRQGDPGSSRFYLSLEDDLMRLFGSDSISNIMDRLGLEEDQPIEHSLITRAIENAQRKVEARNFEIRRRLLGYDDILNEQRAFIYQQRQQILKDEDLKGYILRMTEDVLDGLLQVYCNEELTTEHWDLPGLLEAAEQVFLPPGSLPVSELAGLEREQLRELFLEKARATYGAREEALGAENMRQLERVIMLRVVDSKWMEYLDAIDELREGIGLRAYGQRDPFIEYTRESHEMFQGLIARIQEDIVRYAFKVRVTGARPSRQQQAVVTTNRGGEETPRTPARRDGKKTGRNDPCPCGSGKKFKKCCGRKK
ncbi:MAG TPA: preprotein translocase subunit SecA [Firmicutes bacterium]|jgi:preprotein translocase subunit SecA|nr:preprotein translocase subunit SecA [Bacillota bacterium]